MNHPLLATGVAAVLLAAMALSVSSAAAADSPPVRVILPDQYFTGAVNDVAKAVPAASPALVALATVKVVCPGPIWPGRKGHPAGGQTEVVRPAQSISVIPTGYTGSRGFSVVSTFGQDRSSPLTFRAYDVPQAIPTSLTLPCSGTGRVVFKPAPSSRGARSTYVPVRYVDIAV